MFIYTGEYLLIEKTEKLKFFKVCVAVAVFNESNYILKTLKSLKEQCFEDVQFIVCDNASTDDTWDKIVSECSGDSRFTLHKHDHNIGAADNLAFAFNCSSSLYFMWLGGHDYISPDLISRAVECLDENEGISMVSGKPYHFINDEKPKLLDEAIYDFSHKRLGRYLQSVRSLGNCTIVQSMFRRRHLDDFEFRVTISLDHVLISHLLWYGKLYYLSNSLYFRRYFDCRIETQSQRISNHQKYLSRYEFLLYYLDDFSRLYQGDKRIKAFIENQLIDALQHRFGVQSLIPNDDVLIEVLL